MQKKIDTNLCPYVNKEEAIQNMGGMTWLYDKQLSKFISSYTTSADTLRQLISSGATEEARRLIHTIKGLAGTFGFSRLYCASAELEKAIADSSGSLDQSLEFYSSEFATTLDHVHKE